MMLGSKKLLRDANGAQLGSDQDQIELIELIIQFWEWEWDRLVNGYIPNRVSSGRNTVS